MVCVYVEKTHGVRWSVELVVVGFPMYAMLSLVSGLSFTAC